MASGSIMATLFVAFSQAILTSVADRKPTLTRQMIFGEHEFDRSLVTLHDDGTQVAYLALYNGKKTVMVHDIDKATGTVSEARPVTFQSDNLPGVISNKGIFNYKWTQLSNRMLVIRDVTGMFNLQWQLVDTSKGQSRDHPKDPVVIIDVRGEPIPPVPVRGMSAGRGGLFMFATNIRKPTYFDYFTMDLLAEKPAETMKDAFENDQFMGYEPTALFDSDLKLRLFPSIDYQTLEHTYWKATLKNGTYEFEIWRKLQEADGRSSTPIQFNNAGNTLYWYDSEGRKYASLVADNFETKERKELYAVKTPADLGGYTKGGSGCFFLDTVRDLPAIVVEWYLHPKIIAIDNAFLDDADYMNRRIDPNGYPFIFGVSDDMSVWLLRFDHNDSVPVFHLYFRDLKTSKILFPDRDQLKNLKMPPTTAHVIPVQDFNMTLYMTSPIDATGPSPLVLLIHGGPNGREFLRGDNHVAKLFADRGYRVIQPNYRCSTGFGKAFLMGCRGEWGSKVLEDIYAAAQWAINNNLTTKDNICVSGTSWGGYASWSLITYYPVPNPIKCALIGFGITNIIDRSALQENEFYNRITVLDAGDPSSEIGKDQLKRISPIFSVDKLKTPVFLSHGISDTNVVVAQSDTMVNAIGDKSPITYVKYAGEGHVYSLPQNNIADFALYEMYLNKYLPTGSMEAVDESTFKGSTMQLVKDGGLYIPGYSKAGSPCLRLVPTIFQWPLLLLLFVIGASFTMRA